MRDTSIPKFLIPVDGIRVTAEATDTVVLDKGLTYNQVNTTYNQAGVQYGGAYNVNEDIHPSISVAKTDTIHAKSKNTQAQVSNDDITYNQAGYSYNQAGVRYGGLYNAGQDIIPEVSLARDYIPSVNLFFDIYTNITPPVPGQNQSIGPGFFMFITH